MEKVSTKNRIKITDLHIVLLNDFKVNLIFDCDDKSEYYINLLSTEEEFENLIFFMYDIKRLKEVNDPIVDKTISFKSGNNTKEGEKSILIANSVCDNSSVELSVVLSNSVNDNLITLLLTVSNISMLIENMITDLFKDAYCSYGEHYDYIERNLKKFLMILDIPRDVIDSCEGMAISHGDKISKTNPDIADIPYGHACLLYMLSIISPYSDECRNTPDGFVSPFKWIKENYQRFFHLLPRNKKED